MRILNQRDIIWKSTESHPKIQIVKDYAEDTVNDYVNKIIVNGAEDIKLEGKAGR